MGGQNFAVPRLNTVDRQVLDMVVGRQNSIQAPLRSGAELRVRLVERRMLYVALLLGCLGRALRPRSALLLENLALRQQLAVYQRRGARPRLRAGDRRYGRGPTGVRRYCSSSRRP
jgi:hypothetical protein